mgnify:CR=1 FL=1
MTTNRVVKKNLGLVEDLSFGEAQENQTRNGGSYTGTQIRGIWIANSIEELQELDPIAHPKVLLVFNGASELYVYNTVESAYEAQCLSTAGSITARRIGLNSTTWQANETGRRELAKFNIAGSGCPRLLTIAGPLVSGGTLFSLELRGGTIDQDPAMAPVLDSVTMYGSPDSINTAVDLSYEINTSAKVYLGLYVVRNNADASAAVSIASLTVADLTQLSGAIEQVL